MRINPENKILDAQGTKLGNVKASKNNNKSIFEKLDKDGIVNEEDFANNKTIGEKVKSLGYFGVSWDSVRTIINSLFTNTTKDGFANTLTDEYQNINNQLLLKDIDVTKSWDDVVVQMKRKNIQMTLDGSYTFTSKNELNVKVMQKGGEIHTEIRNKDGKLLQTIDAGEATRNGFAINVNNYNSDGKQISFLGYSSGKVLNLMETYEYDSNGNEQGGVRYLPPRNGVEETLKEGKKISQGVLKLTPYEHRPIRDTYVKHNAKGNVIK